MRTGSATFPPLLPAIALVCAAVWLAVSLLLTPRPAHAVGESLEVTAARLDAQPDEGLVLSVDVSLALSPRLEDAVSRGVPLWFVLEFELTRPRWYWWDERAVSRSQTWRLSYHALTRQYRVALNNGIAQSYGTLAEALAAMSRVRGWRVAEGDRVSRATAYDAAVRFRLDTQQLPKPFQVSALTDREWTPESPWRRFTWRWD